MLGEDGQHLARDATGFGESHKGIEDGKGNGPPDFVTDGGIAADDRQETLERSRQDDKVAVLERTAPRLARARSTDRRRAVERDDIVVHASGAGNARRVVESSRKSRRKGRNLGRVLQVAEQSGVEIAADREGDARLQDGLQDGPQDAVKAFRRYRLDRLACVDKEERNALVAQLGGEQDCGAAEKLADRNVQFGRSERRQNGVQEVEQ